VNLKPEQIQLIREVADLWAQGLTQGQVAKALDKNPNTLRGRLRYYGCKFARGGKLVWTTTGKPVDLNLIAS